MHGDDVSQLHSPTIDGGRLSFGCVVTFRIIVLDRGPAINRRNIGEHVCVGAVMAEGDNFPASINLQCVLQTFDQKGPVISPDLRGMRK